MNSFFPDRITIAIQIKKLIKIMDSDKRLFSERMSSRMIKCASVLQDGDYLGWQIYIPQKGLINMSVFGTDNIDKSDLEWIVEKIGKTTKKRQYGNFDKTLTEIYELYLPIAENGSAEASIGFGAITPKTEDSFSKWPVYFSNQFQEMVRVLQDSGAMLRVVISAASKDEQIVCQKTTLRLYDNKFIDQKDYIGCPVKIRVLMRIPSVPSVRLRTVMSEAVQGIKFRHIGKTSDQSVIEMWEDPIKGAAVLPEYAARMMMLEPEIREQIIGIELCEEEVKKIPASHKNSKDKKAVVIGKALNATGIRGNISIGEIDLKRHYQIVGQTGTGKSTLLSTMILSAIKKGYGLTFFDPHGSTIDVVLKTIPEEYADRIRVVRIGDTENPVPLNIWDSDDPVKEERNISDLAELFSDLFDPLNQGWVGPRYERWLSIFAKASIAFLGKRASLESIAVLSQSQDNMFKLSKAIIKDYPELVETIKEEYGKDKSNDWHQTLAWFLCKFQRLTSVEQLRKTLGAGANALDFLHTIDSDTVTLIDLASPEIGTHASRIVGTLILMKLWNAILARKEREKTHLVVVDEASLFQTNPMPRMLAESRKFGISMILSHQHTGQLSREIRDALEANSANLSAFRLSPRDAYYAAIRFNNPEMQFSLTRLDAFNAITTLSVDGKQTAPFMLETIRPKQLKNGDEIARKIEERSIATLVNPYRSLSALTPSDILALLNNLGKMEEEPNVFSDSGKLKEEKPEWIGRWERKRNELRKAG